MSQSKMTDYIQLQAIYVFFITNVSTYNDIVNKTHLLMHGQKGFPQPGGTSGDCSPLESLQLLDNQAKCHTPLSVDQIVPSGAAGRN